MPEKTDKSISENTKIRLGLVITLIGFLVAGTWWASSVTSKLDTVISNQIRFSSEFARIDEEYAKLKLEVSILRSRIDVMDALGRDSKVTQTGKYDDLLNRVKALEAKVHGSQ